MSYTIRPHFRTEKKNKDGKSPVAVCVTVNRARTYSNTGISLLPTEWDEDNKRVRPSVPNSGLLNGKLRKKITDLEGELLRLELDGTVITLQVAKAVLANGGENKSDFLKYAGEILERMKKTSAAGTMRVYNAKYDKLVAYTKGRLSFSDITPAFLNKYYLYLLDEGQVHNTTIASFKFLRLVFNRAKEEKIVTKSPFAEWKYPIYKPPVKQYLTAEERKALETQLYKGSLSPVYENILAHFLIECYCGVRHSDWHKIATEKILDGENLYLNTTKTGVRITIPLDNYPSLKKVVEFIRGKGYVYAYSLEEANRSLKAIAAICGVNKRLTTHVGRHTAATLLLESGLSRESIAQVLGVSTKIVDTYAKITGQKLKNEFESMKLI